MTFPRIGFAALQFALIAGLVWWGTTDSGDGISRSYLWFLLGMPLLLALSWAGGRRLRGQAEQVDGETAKAVAEGAQLTTLVLLGLALVVTPLALFGALFEGIG
jgi:hypothetical protein